MLRPWGLGSDPDGIDFGDALWPGGLHAVPAEALEFVADLRRRGELSLTVFQACASLRDLTTGLLILYRGSMMNTQAHIIEAIREADVGVRPLLPVANPDTPLPGVLSVCEVVDDKFTALRAKLQIDPR